MWPPCWELEGDSVAASNAVAAAVAAVAVGCRNAPLRPACRARRSCSALDLIRLKLRVQPSKMLYIHVLVAQGKASFLIRNPGSSNDQTGQAFSH